MPQKIFDILPPPPTTFREEKLRLSLKKAVPPLLPGKKKWWGKVVGGFLLILILVGISCYFTLSRAEIEVWPVTELLTQKTKVTINKEINQIDFSNKLIPGKIFETEKTISEEFPSSGKILKEERAEGKIRVYNNYSTDPQVLVVTTRFVSADGKLFRSIEKVTIPGGKYEGGKFIPGYLDIEVRADQPGPEYNISPSTFSIPGFAGTPRYTAIYGKSFEPMTGGVRAQVPQVSQEDLEKAKKILEEKALNESRAAILEKISSEFILLEGASVAEILETFSSARPKAELEKFIFQVKAKGTALVGRTEDLENFAKEFILSQIPESKRLYQESLKINYFPETIDLKLGKLSLSLNMEAKIYSPFDELSLKKGLSGKSLAETKIFLENLPQVSRAEIKLWPFWVKKVPEDLRKIEIKLRID